MTMYEIEVLIWYHTRGDDHPDLSRKPPVWAPTIEKFLREDVMIPTDEMSLGDVCYQLTDRGRQYCESLKRVPLPEATWITKWPVEQP